MADKILLVEDDYALALGTEYALQAEGYEVVTAGRIEQAYEMQRESRPDLILLDVMLPDGNGYDFCRKIRQEGCQTPIIFLTAVGEEVNIVQGLECGADDYVTKPYRVKELLSRIAANLRRYRLTQSNVEPEGYHFGQHCFYPKEFRLYRNGELVDCTPNDLRLLGELIAHEGQVLERGQILERLFDTQESFVDDNTLSVYMKRLRGKLGEDAEYIETVRGVGYRFTRKGTEHGK